MSEERPAVGITRSVVDALKVNPIVLAMLILNVAFICSIAYFVVHFEEMRQKVTTLVLDRCLPKGGPQ